MLGYGNIVPGYENIVPGYGKVVPRYGNIVPRYGKVVPRYGKVVPRYGNIVPGYVKVVPRYGKVVPGYGKVVPRYESSVLEQKPCFQLKNAVLLQKVWLGGRFGPGRPIAAAPTDFNGQVAARALAVGRDAAPAPPNRTFLPGTNSGHVYWGLTVSVFPLDPLGGPG